MGQKALGLNCRREPQVKLKETLAKMIKDGQTLGDNVMGKMAECPPWT